MLRYAVAFAGNGVKDVTRRYCSQWYKIAPHRVFSEWWDTVLAPLKELESRSCGASTYSEVHLWSSSTEMINMQDQSNSTSASFTGSVGSLSREYPKDAGLCEIPEAEIQEQHANRMDGKTTSLNFSFTTRASLEDMELETQALTEPLPTNQQVSIDIRHHLQTTVSITSCDFLAFSEISCVLNFNSGVQKSSSLCY